MCFMTVQTMVYEHELNYGKHEHSEICDALSSLSGAKACLERPATNLVAPETEERSESYSRPGHGKALSLDRRSRAPPFHQA